ncbi:tyrosine-type recombinase/integrase [Corynebacterium mastitidis]|uniref:Site-specific integrase n=1 Tax=Corynebacterium mastitidis TaxID=161890 RepID=A0A2N0X513_9CORY|nr:tyrosine-type recombinase/integrase [Corynebacterium mastitidis]MCH6197488.1 tyrosine-type recombinase/integrase [Corynebacterium mastitidis]PKF67786.1 site-specific integrase [Corynebacterium mastitidis]
MASIKKYASARAKGGYAWRVQYRGPDGKSHTKQGFRTKSEAERWAEKNAVSAAEGTWIDPAHGKATVGELGQKWLGMQTHLKPSTRKLAESTWEVHVRPRWEAVKAQAILPSDVQQWLTEIKGSATTVRRAHAQLAQILDMAVADRMMLTNPARGVTLPRRNAARRVYLTAEQLGALAAACSKHGELVLLLGTVGLRWGEAIGLQVGDLDFLRHRATIKRNAVWVGKDLHIGTPKTHEARTVMVPRAVLDAVEPLTQGKAKGDWVWSTPEGSPLPKPGHGSWLHGAVERVRKADADFPVITPHGLRHVAAGLMVSSGANVKIVQRQLGHASAAMTLDTYADLFDEDLDGLRMAMDEALSGVSWDCRGIAYGAG